MTSLIDELRADQGRPTQCVLCAWLAQMPAAERAEWAVVAADRSFTIASLYRAAKKRGFPSGPASIENHRKREHL